MRKSAATKDLEAVAKNLETLSGLVRTTSEGLATLNEWSKNHEKSCLALWERIEKIIDNDHKKISQNSEDVAFLKGGVWARRVVFTAIVSGGFAMTIAGLAHTYRSLVPLT